MIIIKSLVLLGVVAGGLSMIVSFVMILHNIYLMIKGK